MGSSDHCSLISGVILSLCDNYESTNLTLKVLVATIDAQWEGMGDAGRRGTSRHYFPHARP